MIPRTVLIASGPFDGLSAEKVGSAVSRGLGVGGWETDLCPILLEGDPPIELRKLLDVLGLDARMRRARAVVIGEAHLREPTLLGHPTFEIATRARQAGVPAYAVTAENALDAFDARILDLQLILEARSARALTAAGRKLAGLI
jgi:Glycerate kinase family